MTGACACDLPRAARAHPQAAGAVLLSLNEVEALCMKAARGAGFDWGIAEEAGAAAAWLCARGIDGAAALLSHLDWMEGRTWDEVRPMSTALPRPRGGGTLCPLALGTALADGSVLPGAAPGVVHAPVLLLPFLHALAAAQGCTLAAAWDGVTVTVGPDGTLAGDGAALAATATARPDLSARAEAPAAAGAAPDRLPLSPATLAGLEAYALRTTVPASGASRADAGAAGGDND